MTIMDTKTIIKMVVAINQVIHKAGLNAHLIPLEPMATVEKFFLERLLLIPCCLLMDLLTTSLSLREAWGILLLRAKILWMSEACAPL